MTEPILFTEAAYKLRGYSMWKGMKVRFIHPYVRDNAKIHMSSEETRSTQAEIQSSESAPVQESDLGRAD